MSELKYQLMLNKERSWVPCYLKCEADKVIADLEENHKKEVEQLLIDIAELKGSIKNIILVKCLKDKELRHQKYRRFLAMADYCYTNLHCIMGHRLCSFADWKKEWFARWHKRWLKIAEKFKPIREVK